VTAQQPSRSYERRVLDLLPILGKLPIDFTSKEFVGVTDLPMWDVSVPLRKLHQVGFIELVGKTGYQYCWRRVEVLTLGRTQPLTLTNAQTLRMLRWVIELPSIFSHWEAEAAFGGPRTRSSYRLRKLRAAGLIDRNGYNWYRTDPVLPLHRKTKLEKSLAPYWRAA
jgi:hypothetical protein